ncbi:MAG: hypothetical protein ACLS43_06255 [Evtepia gabavorous]
MSGTDRRRSPALYPGQPGLEEGGPPGWGRAVAFLHGNFGDLAALLDGAGVEQVDGMLFDLGCPPPAG